MVPLHVTLNVKRCAQPNQNSTCLFLCLKDIKIYHFKSPSSSDVAKITDTFYIMAVATTEADEAIA